MKRITTMFTVIMAGLLFAITACTATPAPTDTYSVHMPVAKGWGPAVRYVLSTNTSQIGWSSWDEYPEATRDVVYSTPTVSKSLATDLLRNICKVNPSSGAIRINQATGGNVLTCSYFAPKPKLTQTTDTPSSNGGWVVHSSGKASHYDERGTLAWSSSGVRYSNGCAHKTLSRGTHVKVVSNSGRVTYCRVDDRGPYISGRIIDLQPSQFSDLASLSAGVIGVTIYVKG